MYKHCTTEESAQRQKQLEQCLLELMAEIPFSGITIGQICEKVNLSRKSFYRYFDSKEDCLNALLDHVIMRGSTYYMEGTVSSHTDLTFCIRFFEYWQQQTPLLDVLEKNGLSLQLLQRIVRYILEEEPAYATYMGISPSDLMEHVVFLVNGMMGMVLTWHHGRYEKTAVQMGHILYRLMQRQTGKGDDVI